MENRKKGKPQKFPNRLINRFITVKTKTNRNSTTFNKDGKRARKKNHCTGKQMPMHLLKVKTRGKEPIKGGGKR